MSTPEVVLQLRTDPGELGRIRATIRSPAWTRDAWFAAEGVQLRQDATPFIPPALLVAMRYRARLVVDGEVSPLLLSNLAGIQAMFCVMRPRWRAVEVRAAASTPAPAAQGSAAFLSMGLDSLSLATLHKEDLSHLILLRNFSSEPASAAARIERGARELAERDGKTLLILDSNLREIARGVAGWTRFHGAGLAASATALSPLIGSAMIASSMWQQEMLIYPSNPTLDHLWSSEETGIVHGSTELTRTEKAISIASDELALRYLHPCFLATGEEYNCGRCGKCLRTMVCLRVAGVIGAPAFDHGLDLSLLAAQPGTLPPLDSMYRESLWGALTFAPDDTELADALRAALVPARSRIARYRLLLQKPRAN